MQARAVQERWCARRRPWVSLLVSCGDRLAAPGTATPQVVAARPASAKGPVDVTESEHWQAEQRLNRLLTPPRQDALSPAVRNAATAANRDMRRQNVGRAEQTWRHSPHPFRRSDRRGAARREAAIRAEAVRILVRL